MTDEVLPVIFRAEKSGRFAGSVTAVFPTEPWTNAPGSLTVFDGAHDGGHLAWYQQRTRPARPEEYAPLLETLRRIYETNPPGGEAPIALKVCRRMTADMHQARIETADRYRARGL